MHLIISCTAQTALLPATDNSTVEGMMDSAGMECTECMECECLGVA